MDALANLPKPFNNISSLQGFHDKLESHMRDLQSLGKPPDTYSTILTRSVLGKLPTELRKQFTRSHSGGEYTIRDVMASILQEIWVLELGDFSNSFRGCSTVLLHHFTQQLVYKWLKEGFSSERRGNKFVHIARACTRLISARLSKTTCSVHRLLRQQACASTV